MEWIQINKLEEKKVNKGWWIKHYIWLMLLKNLCHDKNVFPPLFYLWIFLEFIWKYQSALDIYNLELRILITKERRRLFETYVNYRNWTINPWYIPLRNPYKIWSQAFSTSKIQWLREKIKKLSVNF